MQPSPQRRDRAAAICGWRGGVLNVLERFLLGATAKPRRRRGLACLPGGYEGGNSSSPEVFPSRIGQKARTLNARLMQFVAQRASERSPPAGFKGVERAAELARGCASIGGEAPTPKVQEIGR
jgi:hypothetical protein